MKLTSILREKGIATSNRMADNIIREMLVSGELEWTDDHSLQLKRL